MDLGYFIDNAQQVYPVVQEVVQKYEPSDLDLITPFLWLAVVTWSAVGVLHALKYWAERVNRRTNNNNLFLEKDVGSRLRVRFRQRINSKNKPIGRRINCHVDYS